MTRLGLVLRINQPIIEPDTSVSRVSVAVAIPIIVLLTGIIVVGIVGLYGYQTGWFAGDDESTGHDREAVGLAQDRAKKQGPTKKERLGSVRQKFSKKGLKGLRSSLSNRGIKRSVKKATAGVNKTVATGKRSLAKTSRAPGRLSKKANSKVLGAQRILQRKMRRAGRR